MAPPLQLLGTLFRRLTRRTPPLLAVGSPAPAFRSTDQGGRPFDSRELDGQRYVLWFYPRAETPG